MGEPAVMAHRDQIGALHKLAAKEGRVGRLKSVEVLFGPCLSGNRAPHVAHSLLGRDEGGVEYDGEMWVCQRALSAMLSSGRSSQHTSTRTHAP